MARFHGVCLVTGDVRRLSGFYRDLLDAELQGDETFARLAAVGAELAICHVAVLERMAPGALAVGAGGVVLEFEVADVDQPCARLLVLGAPVVKPPTTQPWGLRSVWFRDPDGNLINFFAPAGAAPGDAAPEPEASGG
jgi:catechol 2,3-dioxygenase-like lactoylglutathione lyase family enzyme